MIAKTARQFSHILFSVDFRLREAAVQHWGHCAFVLSTGRAGTLTLSQLVGLSPDAVAVHEPNPRLLKESSEAFFEEGGIGASEKWCALALQKRAGPIIRANWQGKMYFETNNRLTFLARALAQTFPESKFIHLHRNPYEVIRSGMRRGWYRGHPEDFARIRPRRQERDGSDWEALPAIEKVAWYWSAVNREIINFFDTLPEKRRLTLASATMFSGSEATLDELFEFLGVRRPAKKQIEQVLRRKLNAQRKGEFTMEKCSEEIRLKIRNQLMPVAATLGYKA